MKKLPPNSLASTSPREHRRWSTNRPQNLKYRCQDCGAQFAEQTEQTKMDMHCVRMSGSSNPHGGCNPKWLHHGYVTIGGRQDHPLSTRLSDNLMYWDTLYAGDDND